MGESANRFYVIRMAVGEDDEINVLRVMESLKMISHILERWWCPGSIRIFSIR